MIGRKSTYVTIKISISDGVLFVCTLQAVGESIAE